MASNRGSKPLCYGFGKREGRCLNDAGSTHSQLWCQECDDARRAHITKQMEKVTAQFQDVDRGAERRYESWKR